MSTTFIVTLVLSIVVIAYWRVALLILLAIVLALLVTGVSSIAAAVGNQPNQPTVVAPAEPGPSQEAPQQSSDSNPTGRPRPAN